MYSGNGVITLCLPEPEKKNDYDIFIIKEKKNENTILTASFALVVQEIASHSSGSNSDSIEFYSILSFNDLGQI